MRHAAAVSFAGLLVALGVAAAPLFLGEAVLTHLPAARHGARPPGHHRGDDGRPLRRRVFLLVFGFAVGARLLFARAISQREAADPETLAAGGTGQ